MEAGRECKQVFERPGVVPLEMRRDSRVCRFVWRFLVQIIWHKIVPGVIPLIRGSALSFIFPWDVPSPHLFHPDPQIMSTEVCQITCVP
jgi:hypothetical protein